MVERTSDTFPSVSCERGALFSAFRLLWGRGVAREQSICLLCSRTRFDFLSQQTKDKSSLTWSSFKLFKFSECQIAPVLLWKRRGIPDYNRNRSNCAQKWETFLYTCILSMGYTAISLETGKDDVQIYLHSGRVTRLTAEFSRALTEMCVYAL